jgi:hypothetical protein
MRTETKLWKLENSKIDESDSELSIAYRIFFYENRLEAGCY